MFKRLLTASATTFLMFAAAPKMFAQLAFTTNANGSNAQSSLLSDYLQKKKSRGGDHEIIHAVGGGILLSGNAATYTLNYFPRMPLTPNFSIGAPIGLGFSFNADAFAGSSATFGVELPITADLNFGAGATPENDASFGGFVGAGLGYAYVASSFGGASGSTGAFGLVGHAGIRFKARGSTYYGRAGYLYNLKKSDESVISISGGYTF
jgi:hypothetical protein